MKRTYAPIVMYGHLYSEMVWSQSRIAPAAIFEKEPCVQSPSTTSNFTRTIQGIDFGCLCWSKLFEIFGGKRYHDKEVSLDQYGRPTEANYRM
ncbi:hypothetical protein Plhal304r1_c053g0138271 [Plasmopara halstedii]